MQLAGSTVAIAALGAPGLDRLGKPGTVGAEVAGQRLEEGKAAGSVEMVVAVEHLARHGGAGGFAAARQQRLAQFHEFGGVQPGLGAVAPPQQRAAALGNGRQQVGEKGVGHW